MKTYRDNPLRIVKCLHPVDTTLGEISLHVRYLVLDTYCIINTNYYFSYNHLGIIMNEGTYYEFFDNRFEEVAVL